MNVKPFLPLVLTLLVFSFVSIALPYVASANTNPINSDIWKPQILAGPLLLCTGGPTTSGSSMPSCSNLCDLIAQFLNVIYFAIGFVIWVIAPISVAAGGIMYMLAGANPNMESTAKSILKGVVFGIVIVLCSYLIISGVVAAFNITGIGGFGSPACAPPANSVTN